MAKNQQDNMRIKQAFTAIALIVAGCFALYLALIYVPPADSGRFALITTMLALALYLAILPPWAIKRRTEIPFSQRAPVAHYYTQRRNEAEMFKVVGQLLQASAQPMLLADKNGVIMALNDAARARFSLNIGYRLDSALRQPELHDGVRSVLALGENLELMVQTNVPIERSEVFAMGPWDHDAARYVLISVVDQTELRRAERMRADFLANASHELRTPLASIRGFIETLQGPARNDVAAREKFLGIMHEQAERMGRLIADLLSLSRIEVMEHVAPKKSVDIGQVLGEAIDGLATTQCNNNIEVMRPDGPLNVVADSDEMVQLFTNLIDNAMKYGKRPAASGEKAPDSGGDFSCEYAVKVTLFNVMARAPLADMIAKQWPDASRVSLVSPDIAPGQRYIGIRVEDNGVGIEPETLPRLAERFFRVPESAHKIAGTGLGLAIVKHIAMRHRAGLIVESQKGRGTAFCLYIPAATGVIKEKQVSKESQEAA